LYWMSRYLEARRAHRHVLDRRGFSNCALDQSPEAGSGRWFAFARSVGRRPVLRTAKIDATHAQHTFWTLRQNKSVRPSFRVVAAAAGEFAAGPGSSAARKCGEQLNRLYLQVQQHDFKRGRGCCIRMYSFERCREGAHLFQGVTDSTMSHGEGWQYIQVRAIRRADRLRGEG